MVEFHWYGFFIGLGVLFSLSLAEKLLTTYAHMNSRNLWTLFIWVLCWMVFGARVYHLATDWSLYQGASLWSLLAVWNGGLGIYGAFFGAICGLLLYRIMVNFSVSPNVLFDVLALSFPVGQIIGRWGNAVNGELLGLQFYQPIRIFGIQMTRHPIFLYESVAVFFLWLTMIFVFQRKPSFFGRGIFFVLYVMGYAMTRFFLDFLRLEKTTVLFGYTMAQFLSCVLFCSAVCLLVRIWNTHRIKKTHVLS